MDVNIFQAVFQDYSHGGIDRSVIHDALVQTVAACEERVEREKRSLKNPLNWLKEGLAGVLRLPFVVLKTAGFDVAKIEEHLWAKLFKLAFFLVLIYAVVKGFGVSASEILKAIAKK